MKKENLILGFLVVSALTLSVITFPKFINSNPERFPALHTIYNSTGKFDIKAFQNNDLAGTKQFHTISDSVEFNKRATKEAIRAGMMLSSPFGDLAVKLEEWLFSKKPHNSSRENII